MNLKMRVGFICAIGPIIALIALAAAYTIRWLSEHSITAETWEAIMYVGLPLIFTFLIAGGAFIYMDGWFEREGIQ